MACPPENFEKGLFICKSWDSHKVLLPLYGNMSILLKLFQK